MFRIFSWTELKIFISAPRSAFHPQVFEFVKRAISLYEVTKLDFVNVLYDSRATLASNTFSKRQKLLSFRLLQDAVEKQSIQVAVQERLLFASEIQIRPGTITSAGQYCIYLLKFFPLDTHPE